MSAKKQIFSAWLIAIIWDLFLQYLGTKGIIHYGSGDEPLWAVAVYVCATILLLYGLWNGSRSVGEPLTFTRLINLLLGFPNWIIVGLYLAIIFVFL